MEATLGDPASCSALGGLLRSAAGRLSAVRQELVERTERLRRGPAGEGLVDEVVALLGLLDILVTRLDAGGAVLQRYAQELAEIAESVRRLDDAVTAEGLLLQGFRVVEPWGVLTTELAQSRGRAQPALQDRADRLASRLGRSRAMTARAMREGTAALAVAAEAARARSLR